MAKSVSLFVFKSNISLVTYFYYIYIVIEKQHKLILEKKIRVSQKIIIYLVTLKFNEKNVFSYTKVTFN